MQLSRVKVVARNIDPAADNAIHADDVAQQHGFSGALVPGVELFAYAAGAPVARWGPGWPADGRIALRLRRPVYDGEALEVVLAGADLTVTGPDGQVRCVGTARSGSGGQRASYVEADLPEELLPEPVLGPLGTVREHGTAEAGLAYLDAIGERLALYRDDSVAHPGLLLRLVNLLLMRNVALGPWVHTSSECRLLGPARLPAAMEVRGTVTELYERNGHSYVRYDALVTADGVAVLEADHRAIYRLR